MRNNSNSDYKQYLTIFWLLLSCIAATPTMAAMPFSAKQKAEIIERINICQEPIFKDGYETSSFKISVFEGQGGGFIYCGYNKATKTKIVLPASRGENFDKFTWKAKNGNVEYIIQYVSELGGNELRIVENGSLVYKDDAFSVFPP
ncbi:hypothetical protein [Okeania sp. SIO2B3]|uniref:hypothetical protein n=1 Tax=Okeania sp. SIO2B3 TaxID=2607784 RepID=UPI0013C1FC6A|nr:hypothetical protein [Okeania sp. SIO2B3]NET43196.1 hypothetical protein [Okeania sp. SIO2B3]